MSKDQDQPSKRICVGKITSPHGVRGLVKIHPFCEDISLLEQSENLKIKIKSSAGKHLLAEAEGCTSREEAEAIKGTELFISRDKLPEIEDEDTYYFEDLVGLKAVDENGTEIGKVISVQDFGAGALLEIRLLSGQDVLVPFIDEYIPDVSDAVTLRNYEVLLV